MIGHGWLGCMSVAASTSAESPSACPVPGRGSFLIRALDHGAARGALPCCLSRVGCSSTARRLSASRTLSRHSLHASGFGGSLFNVHLQAVMRQSGLSAYGRATAVSPRAYSARRVPTDNHAPVLVRPELATTGACASRRRSSLGSHFWHQKRRRFLAEAPPSADREKTYRLRTDRGNTYRR